MGVAIVCDNKHMPNNDEDNVRQVDHRAHFASDLNSKCVVRAVEV
jgi:hypothetical protein